MTLEELLADYSSSWPVFEDWEAFPVVDKPFNPLGEYAIHAAAIRGRIEELRLLVEAGSPLNEKGEHDYTPLHEATLGEHADCVTYLLENGADMNVINDDGDTPLELAKLMEYEEIIRIFEERKNTL